MSKTYEAIKMKVATKSKAALASVKSNDRMIRALYASEPAPKKIGHRIFEQMLLQLIRKMTASQSLIVYLCAERIVTARIAKRQYRSAASSMLKEARHG